MSIIFDYPQLTEHKYTCSKTKSFCSDSPFCEGGNSISTVENIICYTLRAILLVEIPIYCIKTNHSFAEVTLCLVILQ